MSLIVGLDEPSPILESLLSNYNGIGVLFMAQLHGRMAFFSHGHSQCLSFVVSVMVLVVVVLVVVAVVRGRSTRW